MLRKWRRNTSRSMFASRWWDLLRDRPRLRDGGWGMLGRSSAAGKGLRRKNTRRCGPRGFAPCRVPLRLGIRSLRFWANRSRRRNLRRRKKLGLEKRRKRQRKRSSSGRVAGWPTRYFKFGEKIRMAVERTLAIVKPD